MTLPLDCSRAKGAAPVGALGQAAPAGTGKAVVQPAPIRTMVRPAAASEPAPAPIRVPVGLFDPAPRPAPGSHAGPMRRAG